MNLEASPPTAQADEHRSLPAVRHVALAAPLAWLRAGWNDFIAAPWPSLFYGLVFAAMGALLALVLRRAYAYVWALSGGFLLVGPLLAMGLYELSRQRERGEAARLAPSLVAWRPNAGSIGLFALVLGVLLLVWSRASLVVIALFFPDEMPSFERFASHALSVSHLQFLLAYVAVGALFAALTFAIAVVSVPMMLDRNTDGISAAITSIRACRENGGAMLVWALAIALVTGAGFALAFAGLAVAVPVIGHATWHAYRALVEPAPLTRPAEFKSAT